MSEVVQQEEMSYVLAWYPYSRSNDLPEAFGQFSKELEVVSRSRGGNAAVDLFTGQGVATGSHIAKTILQSVIFGLTDVYGLCIEQADKIERICQVTEHDIIANVKGFEQGERVKVHFGLLPDVFETLCEYLSCCVLRRVLEMWMAVQYIRVAKAIEDGDKDAVIGEQKRHKFLTYMASELSEEPLILDDEMLNWVNQSANDVISDLDHQLEVFRGFQQPDVEDFLVLINWPLFFTNLMSEILTLSEIVYASYGSTKNWDTAPLVLPILMLSAGALSNQRTMINVFRGVLPENSPRMRAHKRLLLKLFPV